MKKYEVPVIYRGQINYIVKANSKEEAEEIARVLYRGDTPGDTLGNEWEVIDKLGEVKELP